MNLEEPVSVFTSSTSPPSPVNVQAEAVVVEEDAAAHATTPSRRTESTGSNNNNYSYPVATFVHNLVRTSMGQTTGTIAAGFDSLRSGTGTGNEISQRSQLSMATAQALVPSERSQESMAVALGDLEEDDMDVIIVDGDLVQVPRSSASMEEDEPRQEHDSEALERQCRPHAVKKGSRRLLHWFKRRKDKKQGEMPSTTASLPQSPAEPPEASMNYPNNTLPNRERTWSEHERHRRWGFGRGRKHRRGSNAQSSEVTVNENRQQIESSEAGAQQNIGEPSSRERNSYISCEATISPEASLTDLAEAQASSSTVMQPPSTVAFLPQQQQQEQQEPQRRGVSGSGSSNSRESVVASFVGTTDEVRFAEDAIYTVQGDVAYVDGLDDNKDEYIPFSMVPSDSEYKVEKQDTPDADALLRRAAYEIAVDLDESKNDDDMAGDHKRCGKSDGKSVPLSHASKSDTLVHNDILKAVLVAAPEIDKSWLAQAITQQVPSGKPPRPNTLRVDVHKWEPEHVGVKVKLWETSGAHIYSKGDANFGGHASLQSLFFSSRSLYLLVWDLAVGNPDTMMRYDPCFRENNNDEDSESDDDGYGYGDEFLREETNRHADQALQADIQNRVLSWVDGISEWASNSPILPIAIIPRGMKESEVRRRCEMMQNMLEEHLRRLARTHSGAPELVLSGTENILCVNDDTGSGIQQVQERIIAIATEGSSRTVLGHVGTPVPQGTLKVRSLIRRLKKNSKFILVDYLLGELGEVLSADKVYEALHFLSSVGEILYYGVDGDDLLSRCVILCRKWLVSALSCILRNDLKCDLSDTRSFMMIQGIYSGQDYTENEMTRTLTSGVNSNCPVLSASDAQMLWQSMKFMREAADRFSKLTENSTTEEPAMYYFLEHLLVHTGIFKRLGASNSSLDQSEVFFVPSLLASNDSRDVWTYKSRESWKTALCHTWLFRDGAPANLMEKIYVRLLKDLHDLSKSFPCAPPPDRLRRARTLPVGRESTNESRVNRDEGSLGRYRIDHVMCWQSSIRVKISTFFVEPESGSLEESFIDVFIALVDSSSSHCVASNAMRGSMQRVILSGKGQIGDHGRKLWKGGYKVMLESVRAALNDLENVNFQAVCPDCLAQSSPESACTWSWDGVLAVAESGNSEITCMRGHEVNSHLICGTCKEQELMHVPKRLSKPVSQILPSVVLVGLWDIQQQCVCVVGSGFVADAKLGLIVTAAHVLFDLNDGSKNFGARYFGRDARAVIGVIDDDGHEAVWRYMGDVVAQDIPNVDACVVRITSRLANDVVDDDGGGCATQTERVLEDMSGEELKFLRMKIHFELDEGVCILGFNQGGEGVFQRRHVNRIADIAKGFICKQFKASLPDELSRRTLTPREEIVIQCPTIGGHSGGPCVNGNGAVVGILSRSDPVENQRCYLVPASELKPLVRKAQLQCSRTAKMKYTQSM